MNLNSIRIYILAACTALLLIGVVLLVYAKLSFSDEKATLYESAKVIFAIDALKNKYDFENDEKLILDQVKRHGLQDRLSVSKSSASVGEYKVEAVDPLNGWNFLRDVLRGGFKLDVLEVVQNPDHRIDIYLKVRF